MPLEDEMKLEIRKLEKEISLIDDEMEKLHNKIIQLIMLRKKKEHDLKVLRVNFEDRGDDKEIQTSLAKLLREMV